MRAPFQGTAFCNGRDHDVYIAVLRQVKRLWHSNWHHVELFSVLTYYLMKARQRPDSGQIEKRTTQYHESKVTLETVHQKYILA